MNKEDVEKFIPYFVTLILSAYDPNLINDTKKVDEIIKIVKNRIK